MPLARRFPALKEIPRVVLGRYPTPVVPLSALSPNLWIKRDDLSADPLGGNKVRALEYLLGGVKRDDTIVTVGSEGSTHALAVVTYGKRLAARVLIGRWRQEMNAAAEIVSARIARRADAAPIYRTPFGAYGYAWTHRLRGAIWIPAGGSSAIGILGHVNAGLELIDQIDAGQVPQPATIVVPLGTGGTAAGLALAFAIAGRDITVVGARVVPRIVARRGTVLALANRTRRFIERASHEHVPRVRADRVRVVHETYGGAYGRETRAGRDATTQLRTVSALTLDATYSAKAFAYALARAAAGDRILFWLTFDPRILDGQ